MAKEIIDPFKRFSSKYVVDEETKCWIWIASKNDSGYGRLKVNGKNVLAHRFSYEYYVGPIDSELEICHSCNCKKCVNYEHMRQDTRSSNTIDKLKAKNHCIQKLSIDEVIEIKKALEHYYRGQIKDLAHFYKVDSATISMIKTGSRWSHVKI